MSIWDASIETANRVYSVSYVLLVIGAIATAVSTMTLFWSSAVREKDADIRISTANAKAAEATQKAAELGVTLEGLDAFVKTQKTKADETILRIEQSQKELTSAIEAANKYIAPRKLDATQASVFAVSLARYKGTLYSGMIGPGIPDAALLWQSIDRMLQDAGWERAAIPATLGAVNDTATMAYDPGTGVSVSAPFAEEGKPESGASPVIDEAASALAQALSDGGLKVEYFRATGAPELGPRGIIIKIGAKEP